MKFLFEIMSLPVITFHLAKLLCRIEKHVTYLISLLDDPSFVLDLYIIYLLHHVFFVRILLTYHDGRGLTQSPGD